MRLPAQASLVRYLTVVTAVAAATVLRSLFWPALRTEAPFFAHWPVVLFAAWYAGPAAGILATLLSALAVDLFLFEPHYDLSTMTWSQGTVLGLFTALGVSVSWFIGWLNRTARQAQGRAKLSSRRRAKLEQVLRAQREALGRAVREVEKRRLAEEALRQSEEQHRLLAETVPQIVWMARPDGSIEYFNGRWAEYTGAVLEATLGWGWLDVIHPDDRPRALEVWDRALRAGEPYEVEYRLRHHDGGYRWHIARALPLRDEDGEVVRWVGTATDLHDQKTAQADLQKANERFRLAARAAPCGWWRPPTPTRPRTGCSASWAAATARPPTRAAWWCRCCAPAPPCSCPRRSRGRPGPPRTPRRRPDSAA